MLPGADVFSTAGLANAKPLAPGWPGQEPPATLAARAAVGTGLRRMRLYRGWTQDQLQDRSGVDQSIVSRLELGRVVHLRLRRLLDMLGALGIGDAFFVPATIGDRAPLSSADELYERGRWITADALARQQIETIISRRRSA